MKTNLKNIVFLENSYFALNFDVVKAAAGNKYADVNDVRLFNVNPFALFSIYEFTTTSIKHLEVVFHAHVVFLL